MRVKTNPFNSKTFSNIWLRHFNNDITPVIFESIVGTSFVKTSLSNVYVNVGKTHTKGISYFISQQEKLGLKNKILLIYDVPTFFDVESIPSNNSIQLRKIKQYPGFLIHLDKYTDLSNYMSMSFSKSSRYKLNKYKKRLEDSFDISYKMFLGDISKEEYNTIFEHFKILLDKRFDEKGIINNNLDPHEWNFYYEVAYPLILESKAGLFVIYEGSTPIGVTLCYFSENILFDAITVFDVDYEKFHLGSVTIMKLIEWSLDNNIKIFDFSKGYFDYKKRWANEEYNFEYHVLYDSRSVSARGIAWFLIRFFTLKQKLRDKNVNEKLQKLRFVLKSKKAESTPNQSFEFSELNDGAESIEFEDIKFSKSSHKHLTPMIFDFLYLNNEELKNIKVFKHSNNPTAYIIRGKTVHKKVTITSSLK